MRKKMLISIVVISIMLLNCIAPLLHVAAGTDIKIIFEKNMYSAIKDELQNQSISAIYNDAQRTIIINDDEIAKITTLSLSNSELTDLTGLEMFANLKSLDLSSNELTKDSNLEVLNSFSNLTYLDLSSNEIEDLSMVTNIKNISTLNLHNQKFDVVEVIQVDTSEKSDQSTEVEYPLPKILTDFVDYIPSEWLIEKNLLKDPLDYETEVSGEIAPYIEWSGFNHENLKVVYAGKTATTYTIYRGMVKVSIKVIDSTSTLYNSDINLYFITTDSNERGIYIKDTNMYNAIKKQLTKGQRENDELVSYAGNTNSRNLYNRYFDEAQVLVINIDDIINKIPSLKLSNKRIKDLTGIEKFVGLETELDLSGNYIKSIDKLIELEKNQEAEEALLKERVTAQIALVSETISEIEKVNEEVTSVQGSIEKIDTENAKLNEQLTKLESERNVILNKIEEATNRVNSLKSEIERLQNVSLGEIEANIASLNSDLQDLYTRQNDLNKEIVDKTAEIARLEEENKKDETAINNKKSELEEAKRQVESLQTDIANKQAEIDGKNEKLAQVKDSISTDNIAISIYETEIAELRVELAEKQAEINNLLATGGSVADRSHLDVINAQIAQLTATVNELKSKINTSLADKNKLDGELAKLTTELENLKTEKIKIEETTIPSLEEEVRNLEQEFVNNENSTEIENLKKEIDKIKTVDLVKINSDIDTKKHEIELAEKQLEDAKKQITDKQTELKEANAELEKVNNELNSKIEEIKKVVESMNANNTQKAELNLKLTELRTELARQQGILATRMGRLYTIYNRIDRLTGIITPELRNITDKEFYDLTYEGAKSLFNSQVAKIKNMEAYLTSFESNYLINLYDIPTSITTEVEKKVVNPDGSTTTVTETKTQEIENPISKWFSELANDEWTLSDYKMWLYNLKRDDIYFAMYSYCYITRLFEGTTDCVANVYADYIIERLEIDGEDTSMYENAKENYQSIYEAYAESDRCEGTATTNWLYNYAKRITLNSNEVDVYVYLPRLKVLDIRENLIENIDNISELTKLVKLYAGDNEIVDISKVDWSSINEHLRTLDLSLNDISNIEPLEVMTNLEYLDLSKNLIEGEFTFKIQKLDKLKYVDFSYNRIDDIQKLINYLAYEARAHGYNGDIASYLRAGDFVINFKHQQLEMTIENVLPIGDTQKVDLPKIFRQIEEIDYANTSFGIDSIRGNVTSDGKYVILDTRAAGKYVGTVTIINTKTTSSFGFGTTCVITYRVGTANMLQVKVTPETAEVQKAGTQQFTAEVTGENVPYSGVVWSIRGNESENTTISEEGLLQVAEDETATAIEVIATSAYDGTAVGKAVVTIKEKGEIITPENPDDNKDPVTPENPDDNKDPVTPENPDDNKDPVTPENPDDNKNPVIPENPDDNNNENVGNIELGYKVGEDSDYLTGIKAQTSVEDFKSILLNNSEYKAVVKSSNKEITTGYVGTGMFVQIQDKNGNVVKDSDGNLKVYEIIVKGDVNGDGKADSIDTVSIKAHRAEVKLLKGAALKAADLNNDASVDFADSKLLLYHRAEVNGYNLNYKK